MRNELTRDRLATLMREIARHAPSKGGPRRVYLVGGGTAVWAGWRKASVDVDLHTEHEELFSDVQGLKERLNLNIEFTRPEHFVPALPGAESRHVLVERIGRVEFYHYDPYSQCFTKVVRGFTRDLDDARHFVSSGMVEPGKLADLVAQVPDSAFARYPSLSPDGVRGAIVEFVREVG